MIAESDQSWGYFNSLLSVCKQCHLLYQSYRSSKAKQTLAMINLKDEPTYLPSHPPKEHWTLLPQDWTPTRS